MNTIDAAMQKIETVINQLLVDHKCADITAARFSLWRRAEVLLRDTMREPVSAGAHVDLLSAVAERARSFTESAKWTEETAGQVHLSWDDGSRCVYDKAPSVILEGDMSQDDELMAFFYPRSKTALVEAINDIVAGIYSTT